MKCPVDGRELVVAERQGIEIDYCPQCRGVWLDRGELDKIIERSAGGGFGGGGGGGRPSRSAPPMDDDYDDHHHRARRGHDPGHTPRYEDRSKGYKKRRKSNILEELFDFDLF